MTGIKYVIPTYTLDIRIYKTKMITHILNIGRQGHTIFYVLDICLQTSKNTYLSYMLGHSPAIPNNTRLNHNDQTSNSCYYTTLFETASTTKIPPSTLTIGHYANTILYLMNIRLQPPKNKYF